MTSTYHIPVLLPEVLNGLNVKPGEWYIDGTLGGGGYTEGILRLGGRVLGIDCDSEALHFTRNRLLQNLPELKEGENWRLVHNNFQNMKNITVQEGLDNVQGIALDLGISSYQLDTAERGFSYRYNQAPFDLRLNQTSGFPAHELINTSSKEELYDIIERYGEEERARSIVSNLIVARSIKKLLTVGDVLDALGQVRTDNRDRMIARVFQAFRIAVNQELESLKLGLKAAREILKPNGRLAVVSFHSLEDRIVKRELGGNDWVSIGSFIRAGSIERNQNSRSRSATLRIAYRT